jgi:hypothetical protein
VEIRTSNSEPDESYGVDLLSVLAISPTEALALGRTEIVERLVERGSSRLTAERMAELQLGAAEPGRARTHSQSRR